MNLVYEYPKDNIRQAFQLFNLYRKAWRYGSFNHPLLKNGERFKTEVNNQLEALKQRRSKEQAEIQAKELATAIAAAAEKN